MTRLSIRAKLLIVFMLLFTVAFATSFYWFYQFATEMATNYLRQSLMASAGTAASMVDADLHTQVYTSGVENDAQYTQIAQQLRLVRDGNPRVAAIYTMVRSDNPNELIFVVTAEEDTEERAHLREPYDTSNAPEMILGFDGPAADVEMGADEYGVWLSGYAPIRDSQGKAVAIVGVDMEAEDVLLVQTQVRNVSILVFVIAYAAVFAAAIMLSGAITRSLRAITGAAQALEEGEPFEPERLARVARGADELGQLARVFSHMAVQVQAREQKLKQDLEKLQIEIDEVKRAHQVAEITGTEYF
ncbi:MAG: HAMP domain-containing protein [Chloroflexi bacterium]|nr:HAMP domain-containing protein [Chloroflexota bacterium]